MLDRPSDLTVILQALAEVRRTSADRARSMPSAFYTSAEFLKLEEDVVFRPGWVCLGHIGEVRNPGDYFTTDLVGEPLIVVRDDSGTVRVLSNVCRHRGNLVAQGAGNTKRFLCGYHAWSYRTDGRLAAAPLMEANASFDKSTCALPSFRTEIWQNFIFVNLDGTAAPLAERLGGLMPHIRNYHNEERTFYYGREEVWRTNWKCLAENFMEGYHLSVTHPKTLHPTTPTSLCKYVPGGDWFSAYKAHYNPASPQREPYHQDLTPEERRYSFLFSVFPSFVVTYIPHITVYLCLRPRSPDEVAIRWGIAGTAPEVSPERLTELIDFTNSFNLEDRAKLETLQQGLKSRSYVPGPLAPGNYEGTIWDFYGYMARTFGSKGSL
jgi:choline monooxygenase